MIYLAGPRSSAFAQLVMDPAAVPLDEMEKLLGEKHSLKEWRRIFGADSGLFS